jgi:MFS family permease
LAFSVLVNRLGTMVVPMLVLYVTDGLHLGATTAAALLSAFGLGALAAAPLVGRLSDVLGPVPLMRFSLFASGLTTCGMVFLTSETSLFLGTLLLAAATETYRPASFSIVSQMVEPHQRKPAFALMRLAANLGMSIGPALGSVLASYSYTWMFLVDGTSTLLAGACLFLFFNPKLRTLAQQTESQGTSWRPASRREFGVFLAAGVAITMVFFQMDAALPLYLVNDLHLAPSTFGLGFTLNTMLIVFLEVPLNAATAHWRHRTTMTLGAVLVALGFGGLGMVSSAAGFFVTVVFWSFGEMMLFPAMSAYVAEISPPQRRGAWMGMFTMSFNMGFSVGPLLGTLVMEHLGTRVLWACVLVFGLMTAAVYTRVYEPARLQVR